MRPRTQIIKFLFKKLHKYMNYLARERRDAEFVLRMKGAATYLLETKRKYIAIRDETPAFINEYKKILW